MITENNNTNTQRSTGFRTAIPFYILYDLDLTAHHLRLYGQIEQMESNPDPNVRPVFSYSWFAKQIGVGRRRVITIANELIEKGYIKHVQLADGKWIWTTSNFVVQELPKKPKVDFVENVEIDIQSGDLGDHPPGDLGDHPKILEVKYNKNKTNFLNTIVDFDKSTSEKKKMDYRDDLEFMSFYSQYPRKEKPSMTYQLFRKLHPTHEFVQMLIHDIALRKENNWKGLDRKFIPLPTTYLNQKQWEGEIYRRENTETSTKTRYKTMDEILKDLI